MLKRGEWNTAFKRRWCVMSAGFLYYFESEQVCVCFGSCDFETYTFLLMYFASVAFVQRHDKRDGVHNNLRPRP
jgi:hypothetical protein